MYRHDYHEYYHDYDHDYHEVDDDDLQVISYSIPSVSVSRLLIQGARFRTSKTLPSVWVLFFLRFQVWLLYFG